MHSSNITDDFIIYRSSEHIGNANSFFWIGNMIEIYKKQGEKQREKK